jgi:transcriptional regulator with XRE-family HTH domain
VDSADVVRELRRESGLSQRAFAERVETSGPTVAAYERRHKEPRLSTLQRMAGGVGLDLDLRVVARDPGARRRARREARSLALAAATAHLVDQDFARAQRLARKNVATMRGVARSRGATELLNEWLDLVDRGAPVVVRALLDRSEHGHDLRQMTPFAGIMTDRERELVLAVVAHLDLDVR